MRWSRGEKAFDLVRDISKISADLRLLPQAGDPSGQERLPSFGLDVGSTVGIEDLGSHNPEPLYSARWDDGWYSLTSTDAQLESWADLCSIVERTYWSRLWIIQEYLPAKSITLPCGMQRIAGDQFEKALSFVTHLNCIITPKIPRL